MYDMVRRWPILSQGVVKSEKWPANGTQHTDFYENFNI